MKAPIPKRTLSIAAAVLVLSTLAACTAGSEDARHMADAGGLSLALLGFWHGLIAPVALVIELINRFVPHGTPWPVHMFEKDGGPLYDLGFYLGMAGGPSIVVANTRPRRVAA